MVDRSYLNRRPGRLGRRRQALVSGFIAAAIACSGCGLWKPDVWNVDRYRDDKALDIEKRLNRDKPIVANPF